MKHPLDLPLAAPPRMAHNVSRETQTGGGHVHDEIVRALEAAHLTLEPERVRKLVEHAELVLEANRTMNLTRITDPSAVATLHVVDSLYPLKLVGPLEGAVVDIGSGAGYPGIPISIVTDQPVFLCESIKKKAAFLSRTVDALGLECEVLPLRAEELAALRPRFAATVVARAVSSLSALVELSSPLLSDGGRLVALKAVPEQKEIEDAQQTASMCGMMREAAYEYCLPLSGEARTVYTYVRSGDVRVRLPRRPGLAQKHPLVP